MGRAGRDLLTGPTKFLTVLKNSRCKTSITKSLKIAYISGFTKKRERKKKKKEIFTSFQKNQENSRETREQAASPPQAQHPETSGSRLHRVWPRLPVVQKVKARLEDDAGAGLCRRGL